MAALEERGLDYDVAAVANNADIGPAPRRSAVRLWRHGHGLRRDAQGPRRHPGQRRHARAPLERPRSGRYAAQQTFTPPGSPPVSFARGWATVEAKYRGEIPVREHPPRGRQLPPCRGAGTRVPRRPRRLRGRRHRRRRLQLGGGRQHDRLLRPPHRRAHGRVGGQPRRPRLHQRAERHAEQPRPCWTSASTSS